MYKIQNFSFAFGFFSQLHMQSRIAEVDIAAKRKGFHLPIATNPLMHIFGFSFGNPITLEGKVPLEKQNLLMRTPKGF